MAMHENDQIMVIEYTVKPGDSLYNIAKQFNLSSLEMLIELNKLESDLIYPGQKLLVPVEKLPEGYVYYEIQQGDTLWKIAKRLNTTVEELVEINNINPNEYLYPGDIIIVPERGEEFIFFDYVVKEGDSLESIANEFNVDFNDIFLNNEVHYLLPGQTLKIPRV